MLKRRGFQLLSPPSPMVPEDFAAIYGGILLGGLGFLFHNEFGLGVTR